MSGTWFIVPTFTQKKSLFSLVMDFWQICKYNNVLDEIEKKLPRKCALCGDIFSAKKKTQKFPDKHFYLPISAAISLAWQELEKVQIQADTNHNSSIKSQDSMKVREVLSP